MISVGIQAAHRPQDLPAGRVLPAAREALSDVLRLRQPEVGIHPGLPTQHEPRLQRAGQAFAVVVGDVAERRGGAGEPHRSG